MGERGHGRKLGEGGRAKVLELVVAGRSNSQINRILVEEGILEVDGSFPPPHPEGWYAEELQGFFQTQVKVGRHHRVD